MKKLLLLFLILPGLLFSQADLLDDAYTQFLKRSFSLPANSAGYLLNDGSGGLSWGSVSFAGYLRANGLDPLTADWNVGAFDLTAVEMTATTKMTTAAFTLSANGSAAAPALNFTNCATSGLYVDPGTSANTIYLSINGVSNTIFSQYYTSFNAGVIRLGGSGGAYLVGSAASLQLGEDAAAPTDQTLKAADGSGTDKPGAMLTNQGGQSTGTGAPGGWRVQTSTIAATGSTTNTYYTRFHTVGKVYSLANNTATALFSLTVADGAGVGGKVDYTIEVADGTDIQIESGTVHFAAVNKATETWTSGAPAEVSLQAVSAGTLATTWAADTATADTFKLTLNSNSSLTPTSTLVRIVVTLNSPRALTIL